MNFKKIDYESYEIYNGVIRNIGVSFIGHYGVLTADIPIEYEDANGNIVFVRFMYDYQLKKSIGELFFDILTLTDKMSDSDFKLEEVKDIPIRVIVKEGKVYGIAHFMKDMSFMISDFLEYVKK